MWSMNEIRRGDPTVALWPFLLLVAATTMIALTRCKDNDSIAFPHDSGQRGNNAVSDDNKTRLPYYNPDRCPEDQLLWPGDQETDYVCDCRPGYIYYTETEKCYSPFVRGPCREGEYLVLQRPDVLAKCVRNPCNKDGWVRFKGKCHQLNQPNGPCLPIQQGGGIFGVNETTLRVECLKGTDPLSLFGSIPHKCPPGSRRDSTNQCRENFNVGNA